MEYKVTFKHGFHSPIIVEADNELDAKKLGLAYHRKNSGFVETVDKWPIDFVVDTVTQIN